MSLYKVHPKFQTPYIIQIVIGIIVACITGFTPIHIVAETCSAGTIFAFLCSSVGILVLRRIYPNHRADSAARLSTSSHRWVSSAAPSSSLNCRRIP